MFEANKNQPLILGFSVAVAVLVFYTLNRDEVKLASSSSSVSDTASRELTVTDAGVESAEDHVSVYQAGKNSLTSKAFHISEFEGKYLKILNSDASFFDRQQQLSKFVRDMIGQYDHDQIEAAIFSLSAEGLYRRIMLQALFSDSKLDLNDLCMRVADFSDSDLLAATQGICGKLSALRESQPFPYEAIQLLNLGNSEVAIQISGSLAGNIAKLNLKNPDGARMALKSHFEGLLKASENRDVAKELIKNYVNQASELFPFETWALKKSYDSKRFGSLELDHIFTEMMTRDPARALGVLDVGDLDNESTAMIATAVGNWLRIDPEQVSRLDSSGVTLNEFQSELVKAGLAEYDLKTGNLQSALERIGSLNNPLLISEFNSRYNTARGDQLRVAAKQDPQAAISQLTGNGLGKETFWIEVVVEEWLRHDMQGSYDWYQKNSKTLSPDQSERVALAYARAAIREKEYDTAQNWARHIYDPKLRAVVESEIAGTPHP